MFEQLPSPTSDPILSLITEFQQDTRNNKIDLGIGVYRNEEGVTPIMSAVRNAEQLLAENESTKAYQGLIGDDVFNDLIKRLLLENTAAIQRASALQTPGASGALRMLADLIASQKPNATVWLSTPSYINHQPIMERAGLKVAFYPYLDPETKLVNETAMLEQIAQLGSDDVLLLHGCCHNPSGADIQFETWQTITELAQMNGFLPFVDIAYQGLGDGMEEDARGMRWLADRVEEMVVSTSCSKNFGLYRERTGAAIVIGKTPEHALNARVKMCELSRGTYSMPPAHGAAVVKTILSSNELTQQWRDELTRMNQRVNGLRQALVLEFQQQLQTTKYDYFGEHKGMFTLTGLATEVTDRLKRDFGIYIVAGGRINVAGLKSEDIPQLVSAFAEVGA